MAAGYRSIAIRGIGGAGSVSGPSLAAGNKTARPAYLGRSGVATSINAGNRCILPGYLGLSASIIGPANAGYRSLCAYFLGGACSYYVKPKPPEEPHGGGKQQRYEVGRKVTDDEDMELLIPMFLPVMECC